MRAVIQRVSRASVTVEGQVTGAIENGLLILLGVSPDDSDTDARWLANKIANLRIFEDEAGRMNLSVLDIGGSVLVVSQFTLYGDCRKGRRPSFVRAARPELAQPLYRRFCELMADHNLPVERGIFGAMMDVELCNHGPVTLILDSP